MPTPEETLEEQREWLRVTLSSIGDAVVTTDTAGRVTFLNPVAQELTGWTLADAVGVPLDQVFRIVNEETRQTVQNPATRALREGLVVGLANHTLLIAKDGTERPIDDSAAPIRNAKGDVAGVVLVFRDVTERRDQEHAVQTALIYARSIIGTLRESLLVLDHELRVETANAAFYRTFQTRPEETEGRLLYQLGNREWDIPQLRELLEDLLPRNHAFNDFEVQHDFPSIGPKILLLNARRVREDGRPTERILLAIEDVTERRHAEDLLRDSELRYRRLFETGRDGILILDARTARITDANPFMSELLGYSSRELEGKELWQIGLFRDRDSSRRAVTRLQESGYIRYEHLPLETKAGRRVDVEFVSNLYEIDHTSVIQCNIRDITERVQLERTRIQAEALADLHRRKDEFLAMLSHELRNPLAPIMNAVQLLGAQPGDESPMQQRARQIITRQVGQLRVLLDDLLEVARITTGRIVLHKEILDLRAVVEQAVETARSLIDQKRHQLSVSLPDQPVWVDGDSTRVEQVAVNLLVNATKYTEEGGNLSIRVEAAGGEAVLRVRDTGVGIAPDLLPRIFELFTQSERSLARSQGGLGVGLTVVQKLVEMHGGTVQVASALGAGSEFVVRLPLHDAADAHPARLEKHSVNLTAATRRVLVVDDNRDQAESAAMLIRLWGHETQVAHTGLAALAAAAVFRPHVVLLDIGLPEMDGYEVARRLRQQPGLGQARLIALSGYGQERDRERARKAGFDFHLVKPLDPDQLQQYLVGEGDPALPPFAETS